jgi:monoamine oxidase
MAGLAAAHRLRQAGVSAWVLEARERIGGRVWTDRSRGVVELGAEFIHGKKAGTWELIRQAGLAAAPWPSNNDEVPHLYAHEAQILHNRDFDTRTQDLYHLVEQYEGPEQSVADFMASLTPPDDLAARFALGMVANIENADVTRMSVQALGQDRRLYSAGWGDDFHVADGYDSLATVLAQDLTIHLNTPVTRIEWNEAGATLFLSNRQTIRARRVVVTVPLSLLQAGIPDFSPALPVEKQQAIRALVMGQVAKLALWFDRPFWPAFAYLHSDGLVPAWWPIYSDQGAVLMGYTGGPVALALVALGEDEAVKQGLAEVAALFGPVAEETFVKGRLVDWSGDPWARGGYSYTPVGAGDARANLATPVAQTLFFAGEATLTNGHAATVHGAIESGRRAADEILALH